VTWAALGGRSLRREALLLASSIEHDDIPGARARLIALCGRDADDLDAHGLSRAVVESVAENTSDAVVGALAWGAVGGPAGVAAYRKPRDRPLLIVVTGAGKGKSTSAFGMLLRAWNRDYRCGVVQFIKSGKWKLGEQRAAEALGGIDWMKTGDGWSWISKDIVESADLARAGWEQVKQYIAEERYEFLLLDEFTYPLKWDWIDVEEVVEVLARRPGFQHVVITGRDAPQRLIDAADLVSEVTVVKHQVEQGIRGQQGIEW
jgi:cob(I)alamin adenosyltransferase